MITIEVVSTPRRPEQHAHRNPLTSPGPVYRNESNRKWKLGKGALKDINRRRSMHSLDEDVEAPALFDNQARPPATGWYLYNIQGWQVAYKFLEQVRAPSRQPRPHPRFQFSFLAPVFVPPGSDAECGGRAADGGV